MELTHTAVIVSFCVNIIFGQRKWLDTFDSTEYDVIKQRTDEFNRYCPYTDTCMSDAKENSTWDVSKYVSCCRPCYCEDDCGLECCPDKSFEFASERDFYNTKELIRCVHAQYRPYKEELNTIFTFEMVSSCPFEYTDAEMARKCRREYHEFEFESPLRYFLPAYDLKTDSIYKNIFCAICHNADLGNLDFAHLSLSCSNTQRNVTYIRDLGSSFKEADDRCNFRFFPNSLMSEWFSKICNNLFINRCNVTGKWEKYDKHLEEACLSYSAFYQYQTFDLYKNVHCFLCNGFEEQNITAVCSYSGRMPGGIIFNLDFSNVFSKNKDTDPPTLRVFKSGGKEDNLCLEEDIFNPSQKNVWDLQCPFGMVLADNICFPPTIKMKEDIVMHTSLLLEPNCSQENHKNTSVYEMLSEISSEVENLYSTLVTKNVLLPYIITGFVQFETLPNLYKVKDGNVDIDSIKQISVQAKVIMAGIKDAILPILDLALVFHNITQIGNFKLKMYHPSSVLLQENEFVSWCSSNDENTEIHEQSTKRRKIKKETDKNEKANRNKKSKAEESKREDTKMQKNAKKIHLCNDNLYLNKNLMKFRIIQNDDDTHYKRRTTVTVGVEREPFCPRIALKKIAVSENKDDCKEADLLSRILTETFISKLLSENETHMFFCYEDYFQHLTNLRLHIDVDKETDTKDLAYMYLSLVCLIASIASLLFTLIIYSVFPILRTLPGLNNMGLSVSLLVFHSLSLVNTITFVDIAWLCSLMGIVTHFSLVSSFSWMFICTFHMMKVFVKIRNKSIPENISRTFFIYAVSAILVAATLVAITIVVAEIQSGGQDIGYGGNNCYIKGHIMVMSTVALPVAVVVILNLCMFCVVVFQISRLPSLAASKSKERRNTVIFVKLSTLTGFCWIFGFVYLFTKLYTFAYIFVILNGGQGVFIMCSFTFNRRVWNLMQVRGSEVSKTGTSSTKLS